MSELTEALRENVERAKALGFEAEGATPPGNPWARAYALDMPLILDEYRVLVEKLIDQDGSLYDLEARLLTISQSHAAIAATYEGYTYKHLGDGHGLGATDEEHWREDHVGSPAPQSHCSTCGSSDPKVRMKWEAPWPCENSYHDSGMEEVR